MEDDVIESYHFFSFLFNWRRMIMTPAFQINEESTYMCFIYLSVFNLFLFLLLFNFYIAFLTGFPVLIAFPIQRFTSLRFLAL